ncbi:phage tail protein [Streptomyces sp. NBC_00536]|uniref:phage tail protein n=1 Tax=Streptomyces sp. NBC_00536 TaxID=2975769 RepID=UPI002E810CC4|nr:phage tail protein [Streptomyces sp. NBC_00536]WUC82447.1 phage tail protein [Streptomyces sp. NBC_00536]
MLDQPFAISSHFQLSIGMHALGSFTSCDGLGCTMEVEERVEGGMNGHVWHLPTRLRYTNVTLTRPLSQQTVLIWAWLQQQVREPVRLPGQLVALGPDRRPLVRWLLDGVLPVRWSGPAFDVDQSQPARETLEITHNGFLGITL